MWANPNIMEDYRELAQEEYEKHLVKIKHSGGTIPGMEGKLESFNRELRSLDNTLRDLGNDYLKTHDLSADEIEKIRQINFDFISDFRKKAFEM